MPLKIMRMFEILKRFEHYVPNCFDKVLTQNINPTLCCVQDTTRNNKLVKKLFKWNGTLHYDVILMFYFIETAVICMNYKHFLYASGVYLLCI